MKKKCELCELAAATVFCESDEANLCWSCDAKVHAANFLVARHSRTLLCRDCHSLTPWKASGADLGRAVSVCHGCISGKENKAAVDKEDEENQVVPWSSSTTKSAPPPPAESSSTVEESAVSRVSRKRERSPNDSDRPSQVRPDGKFRGMEVDQAFKHQFRTRHRGVVSTSPSRPSLTSDLR